MQMLMIVFRSSLQERVSQLLHDCNVKAYTEITETVGRGETGRADGASFYPDTNSVILVALDDQHTASVTEAVQAWYRQAAEHSGWQKPAVRVFAMPCTQLA